MAISARVIAGIVPLLALFGACGKKKDGGDAKEEPPPADGGGPGVIAIATDVAGMGLSAALAAELPAAVKGQGSEAATGAGTIAIETGVAALTKTRAARQRSAEACSIRRSVKNGFNMLREMAQEICYIEAESKSIGAGGKYKVTYDYEGFKGSYAVWIDDSVAPRRRMSVCENDRLVYVIDVEAAKDGVAKGTFVSITNEEFETGSETWAVEARFDRGVGARGRTRLDLRGDYAWDTGSSRERLVLDYGERGVALVSEATSGEDTTEGVTDRWTTQGAALIAPNLGSALLRYSYETVGSQDPVTAGSYRAYFDGKGQILAAADAEAWQEGGRLFVRPAMIPRLPEGPRVAFPAGSWDCSGAEVIEPAATEAEYAACDALEVSWEEESCEDESQYAYSEAAEAFEDTELSDEIDYEDEEN